MAEHTNKAPIDNQANSQSEKPSNQIIPTIDAESSRANQALENMEVHHHAQHGEKKNWKSYFWEFLMLFLAVFCGFLQAGRI